MLLPEHLAHERTMLGAIDSYMSEVVHVRPYLAATHREALEHFADWWLNDHRGANDVSAIDSKQLRDYLTRIEHDGAHMIVVKMFFEWARKHALIERVNW